jgi:hypothetical protein
MCADRLAHSMSSSARTIQEEGQAPNGLVGTTTTSGCAACAGPCGSRGAARHVQTKFCCLTSSPTACRHGSSGGGWHERYDRAGGEERCTRRAQRARADGRVRAAHELLDLGEMVGGDAVVVVLHVVLKGVEVVELEDELVVPLGLRTRPSRGARRTTHAEQRDLRSCAARGRAPCRRAAKLRRSPQPHSLRRSYRRRRSPSTRTGERDSACHARARAHTHTHRKLAGVLRAPSRRP